MPALADAEPDADGVPPGPVAPHPASRLPHAPPLHALRAGGGGATHVARFAPHGALLATGGENKAVTLWDPVSGLSLRTLKGPLGAVLDLAWSPDGQLMLVCGADRALRLFDVATGESRHALTGHGDRVTACVLTSSRGASSCGQDRCVKARPSLTDMVLCMPLP